MFKSDKTLVTEVSVTEVTSRVKTRALKQSANTKISGTKYVRSDSFAVTADRPFEIPGPIESYLSISCPFPVRMVLEAVPLVRGGEQHALHVTAECLPHGEIRIQIMDSELESDIPLTIILPDGHIETVTVPGPAHEYVVYPADYNLGAGDSILFQYHTAPDVIGQKQPVMASTEIVDVLSTVTGQLIVPMTARAGAELELKVNDRDQSNMVALTIYNNSTHKYSVPLLNETAPGIFEGQIMVQAGTGQNDATTIWAQEGDKLTVTYVDQTDDSGSRKGIVQEVVVGAPETETHAIELEVRGLFVLNGGFEGKKVTLYGTDDNEVLVDAIYV